MRHLTRWSSAALSQMLLALPLSAATFMVTNTADSGPGSLRQAILNANASAGADTIAFAIPGSGVQTIHLSSPLPAISDPVVVDGYTQPSSSPNTLSTGDNAVILVELDGASAGSLSTGLLNVVAAASTIRGLAVINAQGGDGISLSGGGSLVAGNFIGLRPDGTTSAGNGCAGVRASSSDNIIGGSSPADRNVISGTTGCGIDVVLTGTNNVVLGNYIGTNSAGTAARGGTIGIDVTGTSHIIGGTSAGSGNLISGHSGDGISDPGRLLWQPHPRQLHWHERDGNGSAQQFTRDFDNRFSKQRDGRIFSRCTQRDLGKLRGTGYRGKRVGEQCHSGEFHRDQRRGIVGSG